ncbi:hypothetical protein SLE2022_387200 [Rubroshorea leprosula]
MNSLPSGEDAQNSTGPKSCFYCNKTFKNRRALGGHLRIHKQKRSTRTRNSRRRLSNIFQFARNPRLSVPNSQGQRSSGVDGDHLVHPAPFTRATPPSGFRRMFCTNEMNPADASNLTGNNLRLPRLRSVPSPNCSYGSSADVTYQSSRLSATASAPAGGPAVTDLSLHVGSDTICQFNTNKCHHDHDSLSTGGSKRSHLGEGSATGDANSKKQKNISGLEMESEEPGKKELLHFVAVNDSVSASKALDAEVVDQVDLDLSLHL